MPSLKANKTLQPTDIDYDFVFQDKMPESLYYDHYRLAQLYGGTPKEWKRYLNENHRMIEMEMSAIMEANARQAIQKLSKANSQELSALTRLIEQSRMMQEKHKSRTVVATHFIGRNVAPPSAPITKDVDPSQLVSVSKVIDLDELKRIILNPLKQSGKYLIPTFTEEVFPEIEKLYKERTGNEI